MPSHTPKERKKRKVAAGTFGKTRKIGKKGKKNGGTKRNS